jgi:hypothetical protein
MVTPFAIAIVNHFQIAAIRNTGEGLAAQFGDRPPSALSRVNASRTQRDSDSGKERAAHLEKLHVPPAP